MVLAKNQLKTALLLQAESGSQAIGNFGLQAVITGSVRTPAQLAEAVDAISPSDVRNVCCYFLLPLCGNKSLIFIYK